MFTRGRCDGCGGPAGTAVHDQELLVIPVRWALVVQSALAVSGAVAAGLVRLAYDGRWLRWLAGRIGAFSRASGGVLPIWRRPSEPSPNREWGAFSGAEDLDQQVQISKDDHLQHQSAHRRQRVAGHLVWRGPSNLAGQTATESAGGAMTG